MSLEIKIKEMRVTPVAIADPPLRSSYGLHQPYALRNILEFESEDGIVGISETYGGEAPMDALLTLKEEIEGSHPYKLTGSLQAMLSGQRGDADASQTHLVPGENPVDASRRTYAAIEVGCLDLIGKTVGKPVCDLIGGRVRDRVPFSAYPFYKHAGGGGEGDDAREDKYGECLSPETLVDQVIRMREEYGFKSVKFKAGVLHPEEEIETIKQLYRELTVQLLDCLDLFFRMQYPCLKLYGLKSIFLTHPDNLINQSLRTEAFTIFILTGIVSLTSATRMLVERIG